ncbi:hypothetical protein EI94DRAFT_73930 [Lactarius quietus]|nr:hypothetical protein EI94DRAFT_73930 [Lactarius quietus]
METQMQLRDTCYCSAVLPMYPRFSSPLLERSLRRRPRPLGSERLPSASHAWDSPRLQDILAPVDFSWSKNSLYRIHWSLTTVASSQTGGVTPLCSRNTSCAYLATYVRGENKACGVSQHTLSVSLECSGSNEGRPSGGMAPLLIFLFVLPSMLQPPHFWRNGSLSRDTTFPFRFMPIVP